MGWRDLSRLLELDELNDHWDAEEDERQALEDVRREESDGRTDAPPAVKVYRRDLNHRV